MPYIDMMRRIEKLSSIAANEIGSWPIVKEARGRRRKIHKRKHLEADINDSRDKYHTHRQNLSALEAQRDVLDARISEAKQGKNSARERMVNLNKILNNFDLANAKCVISHGDDLQDVAYVIDNKEYHLDVDDCNEVCMTPITDYRRSKQDELNIDDEYQEGDEDDTNESNDSSLIPGINRLYDSTPRDSDYTNTGYPNLRFVE
jgi:hypothetical protein